MSDIFSEIKKEFPVFKKSSELVYLDSAATALKPESVIHAVLDYYSSYSANIHRGLYPISLKATEAYERARETIARFIGAQPQEVFFVKNATEGVNILAYSLEKKGLLSSDSIVVSCVEHHANFVPWQQLAQRIKSSFHVLGLTASSEINLEGLQTLKGKVSVVGVTLLSNVLGTVNTSVIQKIRKRVGKKTIIVGDVAQFVVHEAVDVSKLGCDAVVFSGHKLFGPTGVGVVWVREHLLNKLPPVFFGGDMIQKVTVGETIFQDSPQRFEAGTPAIAEVIGLEAAVRFVTAVGMEKVKKHTELLASYAFSELTQKFGNTIQIYGSKDHSRSLISFSLNSSHPHDIAHILGEKNICVRAGHHCAQPLHTELGIPSTIRMSFSIYNSMKDIDICVDALTEAHNILR